MAPTMPKKKQPKPTKPSRGRSKSKKLPEPEITDEDRQPGVVYIGHIPHGFYERQLNEYFSQFGKVQEIKLSRSKKNGNSKGYAFVKFQYAAVAKTVADTCHNYLFFNRLLKCEYKPLSDLHPDTFHKYHMEPNRRPKRLHNQPKSEEKVQASVKQMLSKQRKKMDKLRALGVEVDLDDVVEMNSNAETLAAAETVKPQKNVKKKDAKPSSAPASTDTGEKAKNVAASNTPKSTKRKAESPVPQPAAKKARKVASPIQQPVAKKAKQIKEATPPKKPLKPTKKKLKK